MSDPHTSRGEGQFLLASGPGGTYWQLRQRERSVRLWPGRRIWMGANLWEVRRRPTSPQWGRTKRVPAASAGYIRYLRWGMPLFLLVFLARLLPGRLAPVAALLALGLAAAGLALATAWFGRQDEARLLLACQAHSAVHSAGSPLRSGQGEGADGGAVKVAAKPGSPRWIRVPTGGTQPVVVVGEGGAGLAMWVKGQLYVAAEDGLPDVQEAETLSDVPVAASLLLPASPVGSPAWGRQMSLALRPAVTLPAQVRLSELIGTSTPESVARRWDSGARVPIGVGEDGVVTLDPFDRGPHTLVVGGTGSGKSEFLTSLIVALALTHNPNRLHLVLADYKGGAGLSHLAGLPHVEECITDLDAAEAAWLLRALSRALRRRKKLFSQRRWRSMAEAEFHLDAPPRLLVVVDEFQALADQHPQLMEHLVALGTQGRSLGFHLILSTQRPGGALTPQLRSILDLRVALRCAEARDSLDAIGSDAAARLPRIPGRAIVSDALMQTALADNVESVVEAASEAWGRKGGATQRVLPDPLPSPEGLTGSGLYENPETGTLEPLPQLPGPTLVCGPAAYGEELADIAAAITDRLESVKPPLNCPDFPAGAQNLWIGPSPKALPSGGTWQLTHPSEDLCSAAYAMTRAARRDSCVDRLVVCDVHRLLGTLEAAAPAGRAGEVWQALVAQARSGKLVLVATDSGAQRAAGFPTTVLRLPSRNFLLEPRVSAALPTVIPGSGGLPVGRPSDLEGFVSPVWGRVLVEGAPGCPEAVWAQLAPASGKQTSEEWWRPPSRVPTAVAAAENWSVFLGADGPGELSPEVAKVVDRLRRGPHGARVHAEPAWGLNLGGADPIVLIAAGSEALRLLAARFSAEALWCSVCASRNRTIHVLSAGGSLWWLSEDQTLSLLRKWSGEDDTKQSPR